jgi:hypothetical protein
MANYNSSHTGAEIDSAVGRTKDTVVTAGTVAASSAVVVDANKDISGFRNVTLTGQIQAATINLTGDTTIGDGDTDNITINADVNSNIIPNTDNTFDLGSASKQWKDIYVNGIGYIDQLGTDADPIAIYASSGEIDGTAIGSESASTGAFTTISASGTATFNGTVDINNTSDFGSNAMTNVNIDSGTIDGTTITSSVDIVIDTAGKGLADEGGNNILERTAGGYITIGDSAWNEVRLNTTGSTDFVLDNSGRIGIGNPTPVSGLHLTGADNTASKITLTNTAPTPDNVWSIHPQYNDQTLRFLGDSNTVLTMKDTGEVGIGETSPSERLHIGGDYADFRLYSRTGIEIGTLAFNEYFNGSAWVNDDNGIVSGAVRFSDARDALEFGVRAGGSGAGYSTSHMVIRSTGRVGIGTNNPDENLHIKSDASAATTLKIEATTNGQRADIALYGTYTGSDNDFAEILFVNSGDSVGAIQAGRDGANDAGNIRFTTQATGGGMTERMRITSDGNVGIGTTNPSRKLHVNSGVDGMSAGIAGNTYGIRFDNGGTFSSGMSTIHGVDDTFTATYQPIMLNGSDVRFGISGTEKMRIKSDGNVGIGETNPSAKLMVKGGQDNTNGQLRIQGTGTNVDAQIVFGTDLNGRGMYVDDSDTNAFKIYGGAGKGLNEFEIDNTGNVTIAGSLSKGSGSFKINHPLESKNQTHYLVHSFIEGAKADNIYRGKVNLIDGVATINIDNVSGMTEGTFEALNTDIQCFTSNESDWDAVKGSISGNILRITCENNLSTATVSWIVIGERQDQHMIDTEWTDENGKIIVEPEKS